MADGSVSTVVQVSNAAELNAALAAATGGETILLAEGDYGTLNLYGVRDPFANYASTVTIASADPAKMATFSGLRFDAVSNISFDHIRFDYTAATGAGTSEKPFLVNTSQNIRISNSVFDGDLATGRGPIEDGYGTGFGLEINDSQGVQVVQSEFFNWLRAVVVDHSQDIELVGNDVHSIRSDGFDFAAVQRVLVEGNKIHDFAQAPLSTDHMDFIQFWTIGTDTPSTDVIIRANILDSGAGDETQSIFIRNEVVDMGQAGQEMFYRNFLIEENVIRNAHTHGITVGETDGLTIRNNTILHNVESGDDGGVSVPKINVTDAAVNVSIVNNITHGVPTTTGTGWIISGNALIQRDQPSLPNYYDDVFVNGLSDGAGDVSDLRLLPEWAAAHPGVGASLSGFDTTPAALDGFVAAQAGTGFGLSTVAFDAAHLFGPAGPIDPAAIASVAWTFGDGTQATGTTASHPYAEAGSYDVTATVTLTNGETVVLDKTVEVGTPLALSADFEGGIADQSSLTTPVTVSPEVTAETTARGTAVRLNGGTVAFDGAGEEMRQNSEYTLLVDFKKDIGQELSSGRLISFPDSFTVAIGANDISANVVTDKGNAWFSTGAAGIADSDWHTLALTFSSTTGQARLYIDGVLVGALSGMQGQVQAGSAFQELYLGSPWDQNFGGLIDNLHFLRGAMTPEEVATYDSRAGLQFLALNTPPEITGSGVIDGTDAAETITASPQTDLIRAHGGDDSVSSLDGNDTIDAGAGNDTASGGAGNDVILGKQGNDLIAGDEGNDSLYGGSGDDTLDGGIGFDVLVGGQGSDTLRGGADNDLYIVSDNLDSIVDAGGSFDRVRLDHGTGSTFLTSGWAGIELVIDGAASDAVIDANGNGSGITLLGGGGNDRLVGGSGDDVLMGRGGSDTLSGGGGDDQYVITDDVDVINDSAGSLDRAMIADSSGVSISVGGWSGIEQVQGNGGNDTIDATGNTTGMHLLGNAGNDRLVGGSGADRLVGGAGADILEGAGGDDLYIISDPLDTITDSGGANDEAVILNGLGQTLSVGSWSGVERVIGSKSNDSIDATGNTEGVTLLGRDGDDVLTGGGGADDISGNSGADRLDGGGGDDRIVTGAGQDVVVLGNGFGSDRIVDFTDGEDRIDFSGHATVNSMADLTIRQSASVVVIEDGDGNSAVILDANVSQFAADDFIF